ncbi:MAG: class I SAM-dependent methyltransferase [Herminiimonas sp.]|nr:class I SAM-dependent methyltransferase [Herminiimonas sp.]
MLVWSEGDCAQQVRWRSGAGLPPPSRVVVADDGMTADAAFRLASVGCALLWRGDFQNARQLLQAMARRVDRPPRARKRAAPIAPPTGVDAFNAYRQAQSQRARTLGMLLIPLAADYAIPLRRAPDLVAACNEAYGPAPATDSVVTLREILGLIGAHEWRKKGVEVAALGARIHPHYGVFAPVRSEYIDLVVAAPLPTGAALAFDIGTGTGVLAALLARRGVAQVVATDLDGRALACAQENIERLGLAQQVTLLQADLFPPGRAPLVVCNPPWLPARPTSPLEHAVYDPDSRMLRGFLDGLAAHLTPGGEGWLILSDLAEHLGLRPRATLLAMIAAAGLMVLSRADVRPRHPRTMDTADPLHAARAAEVTSLWRLGVVTD